MSTSNGTRRTVLAAGGAAALWGLSPASARAQGTTPLRIGVIPILAASPIFVADKEGWFAEAKLVPAIQVFESGPNMIQALASGTLDVYVAGVAPLAVARSRGVDVKVVAATSIEENVFVAGSKLARLFEGGVAPAEAFKRFRTANGTPARLAAQPVGSVPNTVLQHWLWQVAKVDKADVSIVSMGIDATQQAILVGAVEGGILREPAVAIVTGRDPAIKLVALGGEMFPDQPGTVLALSGAFLGKHPEASAAVVAATVRAIDLIARDPDRATPPIAAALGRGLVEPATIRKAHGSPATRFRADPRAIVDATAAMNRYQVSIGALDKEVPLDGLFDFALFDKAKAGAAR